MASGTNEISRDFVLLDETELHLPAAGDVVVVDEGARDSFWQSSPAGEALPALDDLISDHAGHAPPVLAGLESGHQVVPGQPGLHTSGTDVASVSTHSLVDIIVDDGSSGPFVA